MPTARLDGAQARHAVRIRLPAKTIAQDDCGCLAGPSIPSPSQFARLNSLAWRRRRADGPGAGVLRDATVFPRQRATGCFVACRPTPDNWRVPRPCLNWSSNVPSGTQTARGGRGPWQGRVGCDGTSRNCRQTAAVPICLRRDSGLLPRPRREECRISATIAPSTSQPRRSFRCAMNFDDSCTPSPLRRLRTALTYRTVADVPILFLGQRTSKRRRCDFGGERCFAAATTGSGSAIARDVRPDRP